MLKYGHSFPILKMKKILLPAVLTILLILIAVWGLYEPKNPYEKTMDEIQKILENPSSEIDTSQWEPFTDASLGISGKLPPGYRLSDYFTTINVPDTIYITDLNPGWEYTRFLPENQKPESEYVVPIQYGIIIKRDSNPKDISAKEWFVLDYQSSLESDPYEYPSGIRDAIILNEKRSIFFFYDDNGPGIALYAVMKETDSSEIISFETSFSRSSMASRIEDAIMFKNLVLESTRNE